MGYDMPLTLEEQLEKKEIRSSAEQKTPYNINKHVLLTIYFFLIVLTNRLIFGWSGLSNMLFEDNVYVWLCKKNSINEEYKREEGKRYVCKDQDLAVQNIFIYGTGGYFIFSFLNGLIVDYFGSRISMLIGHSLNLLGWILLLNSSEHFDCFILAGVLIAASVDLGSFATLNIAGLYPGNENLIVNIVSGAGSLSCGTLVVLEIIIRKCNFTFRTFMLVYICLTVGIFFLLTLFIFPKTRYFRQYEFDNYYENYDNELKNMNNAQEIKSNASISKTLSLTKNPNKYTNYEMNKINRGLSNDLEINDNKKINDFHGSFDKNKQNKFIAFFKSTSFKDLLKICTCAHFLCLLIYGPLNAIYNTFYYSAVEDILSKDKSDLFGYLLPFSFIPCVILGNITDKLGVMVMLSYELFFAATMYLFTYIKGEFYQWMSVISSMLYAACANGQLWTFVSYTFCSKYHSTLIGLLNLVSGFASLTRNPLLAWAKDSNLDFTYINMVVLGLIGINVLVTIALSIIRKTKGPKVIYGDEEQTEL
ncbi:transporter, putative [Hepatocystis sp. ex Piliocolobus tephrosceles]|nr:transporter, putative [Hepatocystis sp. ex Piliocolobus tephrosceles]